MQRTDIADLIVARLEPEIERLRDAWLASGPIRHFVVDDLLPPDLPAAIRDAFPAGESMKIKRSLRELKYVSAQMDDHDPLLEESIYAFQDPRIVAQVGRITGLPALEPDAQLYAGGISMMVEGHFLNPHIDNSHDKVRERYRVLNLLYYVSSNWTRTDGGNLELWPDGPKGEQITIDSRFNRLAVMLTNRTSWHSVSPVAGSGKRCCVSNYYFSPESPDGEDYFHVTSFRGRPGQIVRDWALRGDIAVRTGLRKLFPKGAVENKHYYKK